MIAPVAAVGIGRAVALLGPESARLGRTSIGRTRHAFVGSGALDVASATGMERAGAGRPYRSSDGSRRCMGRRTGGSVVPGRSPRLPHGVEHRSSGSRAAGEWGSASPVEGPLESGRILSPPGCPLFRRPGVPRCRPDGERACTTPSADDTRSLWTVPMSSSPTWPIPRCTGMPTEAQPVTIPDFLAWKSQRRRIADADGLRLPDGPPARRSRRRLHLGRRLAGNGRPGLGNDLARHDRPDHLPRRDGGSERPGARSSSPICRFSAIRSRRGRRSSRPGGFSRRPIARPSSSKGAARWRPPSRPSSTRIFP